MNNGELNTQPTIETLLARINEWGERSANQFAEIKAGQDELRQSVDELNKGQDELRKGQDELRKGQDELRADLNAGLRRVERKIEILNDNILSVNADIRDLEIRLEKLEAERLANH